MTLAHSEYSSSSSDIVPSVYISPNIDKYAITSDPTGCVLSNDHHIETRQQMMADDLMVNQNTYVVENSNDVVIGPVTHFHCPVTIIQKQGTNNSKESLEDETAEVGKENSCKSTQEDKTEEDNNEKGPNKLPFDKFCASWKQFKTRRKLLIVVLVAVMLTSFVFVITIAIVFTQNTPDIIPNIIATDSTTDSTKKEETTTQCITHINGTCIYEPHDPQIIPRHIWGARPPLDERLLDLPVKYILVAHTAGPSCNSLEQCSGILQTLQSYAVDHNSPDIGYNFLIASDGNIYVGRGWTNINYLQNHCISVAFMGNYSYDEFTPDMQKALQKLISMGLIFGNVREDYLLLSHSQTGSTLSPGVKIRDVIEKWPHYYKKDYIELPE